MIDTSLLATLCLILSFNPPVRLHTGWFNSSGIALMYVKKFGNLSYSLMPFCREGFNDFAASLFCQAIGYPLGGHALPFNPYADYYSVDKAVVKCRGHEAHIQNCSLTVFSYGCTYPAVVPCNHTLEQGMPLMCFILFRAKLCNR